MNPPGFCIVGTLPSTVEKDRTYFQQRGIFLDCRGPLIIHKDSQWGYRVIVLTCSHTIREGTYEDAVVKRPVTVEAAWIASGVLLYNCIVHEGAIVAAGTVVRSQEVAPHTMVAGSPARVVAKWKDGKWEYINQKWERLGYD